MTNIISKFFNTLFRLMVLFVLLSLAACGGFIGIQGNQPMDLPQAPKGMTYFEFIQDRMDAAHEIQPARRGVGKMTFFALVTPFYSVLYTWVGVHPDGFIAKVTARDASIPKDAKGAGWDRIPDIWWETLMRLSWSALARRTPVCNFRPVRAPVSGD